MLKRKILFSIFNIAAKTYSSQVVTIHSKVNILKTPLYIPTHRISTTNYKMASNDRIVSYEDVKAVKKEETLLIDVREPQELLETGVLPNSINIPLGQVEDTFKNMSSEDFETKFGRPKPNEGDRIIFSCRSGKRSDMAMQIALKLGYCNVLNYGGGWLDWEKHL